MKNFAFITIALSLLASPAARASAPAEGECRKTGCNAAICAPEDLFSICLAPTPEEACLAEFAVCERQAGGECGFTMSPAALACLARIGECDVETSAGCAAGEVCAPGLCRMHCLPDDPGCCAPSRCVPREVRR